MNKDNYLIPTIRKQAIVLFVAGLGIAIVAELVRFIGEIQDDPNPKDTKKIVGLSLSALSEVLACCLLVTSLLLINQEIAKKFQDIVDMRSLAILCVSYCAFVAATILQDISVSKFGKHAFNYIVLVGLFLYTIS